MSETIEEKCLSKGVKLTDQRKIIAQVISESKEAYGDSDHPDVNELYNRVSKIDPKISIATVYRTVKLFEEAGILAKHDFKGGKARYEAMIESHHDHLIDVKSGEIIEFVNEINIYREKGITSEELSFMRNSINQKDALKYETPRAKLGFLAQILEHNLTPSFVDERAEIVRTISADEINTLAKKHLKLTEMIMVVVGDAKRLKPQLEALGYEVVDYEI